MLVSRPGSRSKAPAASGSSWPGFPPLVQSVVTGYQLRRHDDEPPCGKLEQFALDPLVSPAVVLGGEPPDQRGDVGTDRRSSRAVRKGPFPGDQATVPPKDGSWRDQAVYP